MTLATEEEEEPNQTIDEFRLVAVQKSMIKLTENQTLRTTRCIQAKKGILTNRKNEPIEVGWMDSDL